MKREALMGLSISLMLIQAPTLARADSLSVKPRVYSPKSLIPERASTPGGSLRSKLSPHRGLRLQLKSLNEATLREALKPSQTGPSKIGVPRRLETLTTAAEVFESLAWSQTTEGHFIGHLAIVSTGAEAVRIGLRFNQLPPEAEFRFHDDALNQVEMVTGAQIRETLEANRKSGDTSAEASIYWSPIIEGETLGLEVSLPEGIRPEALEFAVDSLSHLILNPRRSSLQNPLALAAGSCHVDAMCHPNWIETAHSIARISFVFKGASYFCTGTLLNDSENSDTPYFLTANHCIDSQTVASTLTSYWFYHASSCNSGTRTPMMTSVSGGATLLYGSPSTDATFLRLNGPLPAGVTFAGWTAETPALGRLSTSIHHPEGDLMKMAFGVTDRYEKCVPLSKDNFSCDSTSEASATFVDVRLTTGTTESGSSGSGVFLDSGQLLFGQLYGGTSSCSNPSGSNMYGLFSKTYQNGQLAQWLGTPKRAQTIVITAPEVLQVGESSEVFATASSGLEVSLSSSPASTCSLVAGVLKGLTPGMCQLRGEQPGNAVYQDTTTTRLVTIAFPSPETRQAQTLTLSIPPEIPWGASAPYATSSSSGLEPITRTRTPRLCRVEGNRIFGLYPGLCQIESLQQGNAAYESATTEAATQISLPDYPTPTSRLSVKTQGPGQVNSQPDGIACGDYCRLSFSEGTQVTLTASAQAGARFAGWRGACRGSALSCTLTIPKGNKNVTAVFR